MVIVVVVLMVVLWTFMVVCKHRNPYQTVIIASTKCRDQNAHSTCERLNNLSYCQVETLKVGDFFH